MNLFKVIYVTNTKEENYLTIGEDMMTTDDVMKRETELKMQEEGEEITSMSVTKITKIDGYKITVEDIIPIKNDDSIKSYINWEGCTISKVEEAITDEYGYYLSDRHDSDMKLVTNMFDVITVEDYCKWYSLYYLTMTKDYIPILISFTFGDIIDGVDHCYYPYSIVEFAIKNNLKIDVISYIAICKMFMEDRELLDEKIPDKFLPKKEDLESVLVNASGNCRTFYLNHLYDSMTYIKYTKDEINTVK